MIIELLNKPYPLLENRWKVIISISIFIAAFILIFQPFGMTYYHNSNKYLILSGYGLVAFIILAINLFIIPCFFKKWFDLEKWTVLKQMVWLIWIVFTIGLGNYYYSSIIFPSFGGLNGLLLFQFFTITVSTIPIIIHTIVNQNILLSRNLKTASDFNNNIKIGNDLFIKDRFITLTSDNGKDKLEIALSDLLFIESTRNYIQVFYIKNDKQNSTFLRSSLKRIEPELEYPSIVKCHRAFLVNIEKIIQVKGNAQGLKLILKSTDFEIPVSRNFSKALKEKLQL